MTPQEQNLQNQIEALKAQLAAQAQSTAKASKLTVKHSIPRAGDDTHKAVKGGTVGLYGVNGQFPISAYPGQWLDIIEFGVPMLLKHILDNTDAIVSAQPLTKPDGSKNDKIVPVNDLKARASILYAKLLKVA